MKRWGLLRNLYILFSKCAGIRHFLSLVATTVVENTHHTNLTQKPPGQQCVDPFPSQATYTEMCILVLTTYKLSTSPPIMTPSNDDVKRRFHARQLPVASHPYHSTKQSAFQVFSCVA
uniref:Secreted protein n=1 Tax=Rhipicephalus zambeziensis TaxID=60191 RepID=A0A224YIA9_9ACAR